MSFNHGIANRGWETELSSNHALPLSGHATQSASLGEEVVIHGALALAEVVPVKEYGTP